MKIGLFAIPLVLDYEPFAGRTAKEVIDWDIQVAKWADEAGLEEMWFAEHYTLGREPSPAPDLMIAAISQVTSKLRLAAGAHLLPYHNPISLAHRLMWLDHMTGGRYIAGVAQGTYPTDAHIFDLKDKAKRTEMMQEALQIILAIWNRKEPFRFEGKFWTVDMPDYDPFWFGPHMKPFQTPHPPIAITGSSAKSPSLAEAGKNGFIPSSQHVRSSILRQHWDTVSVAAAEAGRTADRSQWRILRDVFVGDTDSSAMDAFLNGPAGRGWRDSMIPLFRDLGLTSELVGDDVDPADVTVEYLAENMLMVGSVNTVVEKMRTLQDETGGYGIQLAFTHDHTTDPEPFRRHVQLLGEEVGPRVASF
ncbi:alkanesulfonate monooxygenase SsuD/methylene tetrahydromethanopterin reductase-like flavin-dependent oxidoreductase (luciferase family) [Paenarthrobacter nitroguajacolicus]|uniref:LLM class flavin-dependent oxidoreductase n=1 Tax=Paenarthrobacter nitroguajacolicus TaxID=211146 RepID=UPI002864ABA0|nr:LLM class flavin-dependent oxidoreductase [Paenarthrobacter nitroguajacolicus]MDR6989153.1 alkanesulfonate monooxygenase SsuD/methylene tetrahydromethanopterin reductase-like flavin-dependent oxidoreductase (luciferase family) [Paenarthrobacter nitroguajacolicus]